MTPPRQIRMEMTHANTGRSMKKLGMARTSWSNEKAACGLWQSPKGSYGLRAAGDDPALDPEEAAARGRLVVRTGDCQGAALTSPPSCAPCRPSTITRSPLPRPPVTIQSLPELSLVVTFSRKTLSFGPTTKA